MGSARLNPTIEIKDFYWLQEKEKMAPNNNNKKEVSYAEVLYFGCG